MAHLSSSFSAAAAGTLEITLKGTFYQGTYRDAGFPGTTGGAGNVLVRGYVGESGSYAYLEPIDRYAPVSRLTLTYPGGGVVWNFGTETLARQDPTSGIWTYGMGKLRMDLVLIKR